MSDEINTTAEFLVWMNDGIVYLAKWQPATERHPLMTFGTFTFQRADADFSGTWADQPRSLSYTHELVGGPGVQAFAREVLNRHHYAFRATATATALAA